MPCSDNERSRKITSIKYLLLNSKAQRIINLQKNLAQDSMCQAQMKFGRHIRTFNAKLASI